MSVSVFDPGVDRGITAVFWTTGSFLVPAQVCDALAAATGSKT